MNNKRRARIFPLQPNGSSFIHFGPTVHLETTKMLMCQSSVYLYLDSLPALSFLYHIEIHLQVPF